MDIWSWRRLRLAQIVAVDCGGQGQHVVAEGEGCGSWVREGDEVCGYVMLLMVDSLVLSRTTGHDVQIFVPTQKVVPRSSTKYQIPQSTRIRFQIINVASPCCVFVTGCRRPLDLGLGLDLDSSNR